MKVKSEKRVSLYLELFLLLFLAGAVSLLFFVGSRFVIEQQIDRYHQNKNIVQKYNEKYTGLYNSAGDIHKRFMETE